MFIFFHSANMDLPIYKLKLTKEYVQSLRIKFESSS
jgi:hypothetical protein